MNQPTNNSPAKRRFAIREIKNKVIALSAVGILALIGSLMNSRQSVVQGAGGPTVSIDQAQLPLPVTGSATVSGTVSATQSGPWNVGITGIPTVNLATGASVGITGTPTVNIASGLNVGITGNSEANPLWVDRSDNPARHAFRLAGSFGPSSVFASTQVGTVPGGQRYVIEHYSVVCQVDTGGALADVAVTVGAGNFVRDDAAPHSLGTGGTSTGWAGNGTIRLYAEAGESISIGAVAVAGNLQTCNGSVSGYAVSLP